MTVARGAMPHLPAWRARSRRIIPPHPFTIGAGFQTARTAAIHPQPHDMALDVILTDAGEQLIREAR
jgi:5-formyltetrahydrofolate cyclo-ligase